MVAIAYNVVYCIAHTAQNGCLFLFSTDMLLLTEQLFYGINTDNMCTKWPTKVTGQRNIIHLEKMSGKRFGNRLNKHVQNSFPKIVAFNICYFKLFIYFFRKFQ